MLKCVSIILVMDGVTDQVHRSNDFSQRAKRPPKVKLARAWTGIRR
jgi:hypothetical protein